MLSIRSAYSYDVSERFRIIDDKLKTDAYFRTIHHDFFLNFSMTSNADVLTFVKDVSDAAKAGTTQAAQNVLRKYDQTEQSLKFNFNLGFPIFSFQLGELKVKPNFRALVDLGTNIGVRKGELTAAQVIDLFTIDIPDTIKNQIITVYDSKSPGQDIFGNCNVDFPTASQPEANAVCRSNTGKYFKQDATVPDLHFYAKMDAKVGFFNQYQYGDKWFGDFNLYALGRADFMQILNYASIQSGQEIKFPSQLNDQITIQIDYRLGYQYQMLKSSLALEEIKLFKVTDLKSGAKNLKYGYDPLIRFHNEAEFRWGVFGVMPFLGLQKRAGYTLANSYYLGSVFGTYFFNDRLEASLRAMYDKNYFTVGPRFKLWLMQLEANLKIPAKKYEEDVRLSTLATIDFRLFF